MSGILKDGAHEVVNGAYLWSFITPKKLTWQRISPGEDAGVREAGVNGFRDEGQE